MVSRTAELRRSSCLGFRIVRLVKSADSRPWWHPPTPQRTASRPPTPRDPPRARALLAASGPRPRRRRLQHPGSLRSSPVPPCLRDASLLIPDQPNSLFRVWLRCPTLLPSVQTPPSPRASVPLRRSPASRCAPSHCRLIVPLGRHGTIAARTTAGPPPGCRRPPSNLGPLPPSYPPRISTLKTICPPSFSRHLPGQAAHSHASGCAPRLIAMDPALIGLPPAPSLYVIPPSTPVYL